MNNETVVNPTEGRILGALQGLESDPTEVKAKEVVEPAKETVEEVVPPTDEVKVKEPAVEPKEAPITKVVLDKRAEAFKKNFVKPDEPVVTDQADIAKKYEEAQKKLQDYETKEAQRALYEENQNAYNEVKEAMGSKFSPKVDEAMAAIIASDVWDKLSNLTPQQRMLMVAQTAVAMVGEDDTRLIKETEVEIKSKADIQGKEVKGAEARKRSPAEAFKAYKSSGRDSDLNEAMGVDDILNATIFSTKQS